MVQHGFMQHGTQETQGSANLPRASSETLQEELENMGEPDHTVLGVRSILQSSEQCETTLEA